MKEVWVIEHGSYSDYRVVGVYSSRKNAQMVADQINAAESYGEKATVEKWHLDPGVDDLNAGRHPHVVTMAPDGTVEQARRLEWSGYEIGNGLDIWRRSKAPAYRGKGIPDAVHGTVWATDEQHAVKIANEWRIQALATGRLKP
jgi:hypothetical protein